MAKKLIGSGCAPANPPASNIGTPATSNVTRLPTAAARKVQQHHNQGTRAARAQLPQHPAEHIWPQQREALRFAKNAAAIEKSPALLLAITILQCMDSGPRMAVASKIAAGAVQGNLAAVQVAMAMRLLSMTVGERVDYDWACARIAEGR